MPRFEPAVPQFIVQEDLPTMTAAPFKPTRSQTRKKSNSISALERIVVFTEATQRVKRRLRNVIAGAVGASTSRPKRKVCIAPQCSVMEIRANLTRRARRAAISCMLTMFGMDGSSPLRLPSIPLRKPCRDPVKPPYCPILHQQSIDIL